MAADIRSSETAVSLSALGWTPLMMARGLYIANAHKTSPGSAQILREALTARGLSGR
jgi:hypothetical protein